MYGAAASSCAVHESTLAAANSKQRARCLGGAPARPPAPRSPTPLPKQCLTHLFAPRLAERLTLRAHPFVFPQDYISEEEVEGLLDELDAVRAELAVGITNALHPMTDCSAAV